MKVIASLVRAVEAETTYGGRVVSYEPVGSLWLSLGARRRRERTEAGVTRGVETLSATVRADPRLSEGLVVRFGGADWGVVGVEADPKAAGRVRLNLERAR
ncbi:head-tail adaptor protein [Brevundimonas sp. P7753]|uniref:phage head completion protein n=1 Tax=Brevundimonas sp. P7753 TaxID=2726982 RepID=UPI0015BD9656|nr:head-tail adaptor protein [Brevundimonas sp. P7753]NWE54431.1 head-tail adaptor protein [Brevundimonas sp. P7753]